MTISELILIFNKFFIPYNWQAFHFVAKIFCEKRYFIITSFYIEEGENDDLIFSKRLL